MTRTTADIKQEMRAASASFQALQRELREAEQHERVAITQPFTCGRRAEQGMTDADGPFVGAGVNLDYWRENRTCSYCGSAHPDDVFAEIDAGVQFTPTDKSYKLYIGNHRKFYFQHFDSEQQQRFIDAINAGRVRLAAPGYFYTLPFFCRCGEPKAST